MTQLTQTNHNTDGSLIGRILSRLGVGLGAGLLAGLLYGYLLANQDMSPLMDAASTTDFLIPHLIVSALLGSIFGLLLGRLVTTPGAGLMWGIVFGLLWWIVGPLTILPLMQDAETIWSITTARLAFPLFTGLAVSFGAMLGLLYWLAFGLIFGPLSLSHVRELTRLFVGAVLGGGLAGLLGGLIYGLWMDRADFFPLVASMIGSESASVGYGIHLLVSSSIGVTYGVLFQREIRGLGSSIAWGVAYGFIWWVIGPLTVMPLLLGENVQWSLEAARGNFAPLVGHIIYGVILGIIYTLLVQIWRTLFVESDPLKREPEGPGTRNLRALSLGIIASILGGLGFTVVMVTTNTLPTVAGLVGDTSPVVGFIVHMVVSAIIGATFGLLFNREAYTYGAGLAWGLVYGLLWWFLGPLTLMPLLLGAPVQWSLESALANYPSLVGHLVYGGLLALAYIRLAHRFDPGMAFPSARSRERFTSHNLDTPRPALWVIVLTLGIMLPLLLA